MRFASLGSGSRGNGLIVEAGATRLLIDCGFGMRDLGERLARLGLALDDIDAVAVTHEHADHVSGLAGLIRRRQCPIMMSYGTRVALGLADSAVRTVDSHSGFAVGALEVMVFPVPHDAREPIQFVISDGEYRLGMVTDAGFVTPHMEKMLENCSALFVECNHDRELLVAGTYPYRLKQRIAGRFGHLDNAAAAGLLARIGHRDLQCVVAAHLSEENNRPELVRAVLAAVTENSSTAIVVADQISGTGWQELS